MSGRKRVALSLGSFDQQRMREMEKVLGDVAQDYNAILARIKQNRSDFVQRTISEIEAQQEELEKTGATFSSQLQNVVNIVESNIVSQNQVFTSQLQTSQAEVMSHINELLEVQRADFQLTLDEYQSSNLSIHSKIQHTIQGLVDREQKAEDYAFTLFQDLFQYWSYLELNYSCLGQCKENSHRILQSIDQIQANLEAGFYETAILESQALVSRLATIHLNSEKEGLIRRVTLQKIYEQSLIISDLLTNSQEVRAVDLCGNFLDVNLNTEFWSSGELSALVRRFLDIMEFTQANPADVPTEDLITVNEHVLPEIEERIHQAVANARLNLIASQARFNVAQSVVSALETQGFVITSSDYEANDYRLPIHTVMTHQDKSQVHVRVAGVEGIPDQYTLDVNSFDTHSISDHELRLRTKEILTTLQEAGLQIGNVYQADSTYPQYDTQRHAQTAGRESIRQKQPVYKTIRRQKP